jgi:hypothetical protein
MADLLSFEKFRTTLLEFIGRGEGVEFPGLALQLYRLQREAIPAYDRFCKTRGIDLTISDWQDIPAMPTTAFKELELSCLPPEQRDRVFYSSGTTGHVPSRHFHSQHSLEVYRTSLLKWFGPHLDPDETVDRFVSLTPAVAECPNSSLVFMFDSVIETSASDSSQFVGAAGPDGWQIDSDSAIGLLTEAERSGERIALFGTAFSFVHLLDECERRSLKMVLPTGSRVMETGGYKGQSRSMPKEELHALITRTLGVSASWIVCEYGMSELSSQAYDGIAGRAGPVGDRMFRFPPWTRSRVISPETGAEVDVGETGILQVFDLANMYSMMAIQTEDLAIRRADGFEVLGRAALTEPRGCSLMPAVAA